VVGASNGKQVAVFENVCDSFFTYIIQHCCDSINYYKFCN
jgi:hypothetical protein